MLFFQLALAAHSSMPWRKQADGAACLALKPTCQCCSEAGVSLCISVVKLTASCPCALVGASFGDDGKGSSLLLDAPWYHFWPEALMWVLMEASIPAMLAVGDTWRCAVTCTPVTCTLTDCLELTIHSTLFWHCRRRAVSRLKQVTSLVLLHATCVQTIVPNFATNVCSSLAVDCRHRTRLCSGRGRLRCWPVHGCAGHERSCVSVPLSYTVLTLCYLRRALNALQSRSHSENR